MIRDIFGDREQLLILFAGSIVGVREALTYQFDPAKAKQLLDEAGFRDPDV